MKLHRNTTWAIPQLSDPWPEDQLKRMCYKTYGSLTIRLIHTIRSCLIDGGTSDWRLNIGCHQMNA